MRILEARDGFVKIESNEKLSLTSFLEINDGLNKFIAQVVQTKQIDERVLIYAKILYLYDGTFYSYDGTLPSKDAEISTFDFENFNTSIEKKHPIVVGNFVDKNIEIVIDKQAFNKKTIICVDSNENNKILVTNLSSQFDKSLVIDTLGIFDFPKYVAGVDFKLPLNTEALDFIFEDCLSDATSDSKSTIKEIFQDLSEYSKTVPFVPFTALKTIVDDMVDKAHVFKLLVLKNKLAKFERLGYFATSKNEADNLNRILASDTAVIDLSKLDSTFQNRYLSIILSILEKEEVKPQIFIETSNNINKKNLKKIITGSLATTLVIHPRFKYINEIKSMFTNFIIEPSFVANNVFKTYATLLNSIKKGAYLIIGESTNSIPLVSNVVKKIVEDNTELVVLNESATEIIKEIESDYKEEDPSIIAIEKKSEDFIEKISSEVENGTSDVSDNLFEEENNDAEIEEIAVEEVTLEALEESDIGETSEITNVTFETTVHKNFIQDLEEKEQLAEISEEIVTEVIDQLEDVDVTIDEESSLEEEIEVEPIELGVAEELVISDMEESPEPFVDAAQEALEEEVLTELSEEEKSVEEIEDFVQDDEVIEVNVNEYDEIIELDDSEITEDDIIVEIDENEELDKEIVEDVDKVFTSIKEETFSESDLDFIDELNNSDEEIILTEGMEELTELEEVDDNEEEFLEPLEEINEYSNTPEEKEILETKSASTPIVPVYSAEIPAEDLVMSDDLEQGDTVTHAKYGNGVVEKMIKYGNKTLYSINFDNVGRRLLDPTLTEIKKN